jgi:4-hydroxy-tetrahydrodipicolinate reductase
MIKFGILGVNGKMGQAVLNCANNYDEVNSPQSLKRNFTREDLKGLDFVVDFSSPSGSLTLLEKAKDLSLLVVCGTTGFTQDEFSRFKVLSQNVKVLYSANFSLGIYKITKAIQDLSRALTEYDVEILEKHHRYKKDAPSGTALMLGREVAKARELDFDNVKSVDRNKERKKNEIGFSSIRQGFLNGFHEVCFASSDERIWIGHEAFNKSIFAKGAIEAGIKGVNKFKNLNGGFFELKDVYEA